MALRLKTYLNNYKGHKLTEVERKNMQSTINLLLAVKMFFKRNGLYVQYLNVFPDRRCEDLIRDALHVGLHRGLVRKLYYQLLNLMSDNMHIIIPNLNLRKKYRGRNTNADYAAYEIMTSWVTIFLLYAVYEYSNKDKILVHAMREFAHDTLNNSFGWGNKKTKEYVERQKDEIRNIINNF